MALSEPPLLLRVYADFDGTIARQDVTDEILARFAAPDWRAIEADWLAGRIDAAACMSRQIALIEARPAELDALLDTIELDSGFASFVSWCDGEPVPLAVVSDGVDYFARRVLARHGLARIPVFANHLLIEPERYSLQHPWRSPGCRAGAGVCKCAIAADAGSARSYVRVYVGDGRSDQCVAGRADLLFAKGALATHCLEQRLPYLPFDSFDDVRRALGHLVGATQHGENEWAG